MGNLQDEEAEVACHKVAWGDSCRDRVHSVPGVEVPRHAVEPSAKPGRMQPATAARRLISTSRRFMRPKAPARSASDRAVIRNRSGHSSGAGPIAQGLDLFGAGG